MFLSLALSHPLSLTHTLALNFSYISPPLPPLHLSISPSLTLSLIEIAAAPASLYTSCLALWDLTRNYTDEMRGVGCQSADFSGLPIAPLLLFVDEVITGAHPSLRRWWH